MKTLPLLRKKKKMKYYEILERHKRIDPWKFENKVTIHKEVSDHDHPIYFSVWRRAEIGETAKEIHEWKLKDVERCQYHLLVVASSHRIIRRTILRQQQRSKFHLQIKFSPPQLIRQSNSHEIAMEKNQKLINGLIWNLAAERF